MPEIFHKHTKIKLIEYGGNHKPSPTLGSIMGKFKALFTKNNR